MKDIKVVASVEEESGTTIESDAAELIEVVRKELEQYLQKTPEVRSANLHLRVRQFFIRKRSEKVTFDVDGQINDKDFPRTIAHEGVGHTQGAATSPAAALVMLAAEALTDQEKARLARAETTLTTIAADCIESVNEFVGVAESELTRIWKASKKYSLIVFVVFTLVFWPLFMLALSKSEKSGEPGDWPVLLFGNLLFGALAAGMPTLACYTYFLTLLPSDELASDARGKKLMKSIGLESAGGVKTLGYVVSAIFTVLTLVLLGALVNYLLK